LKIIFRIIYFTFSTNILYSAWKVHKLFLYKDRSVLFWSSFEVSIKFKSFRVIYLFAYFGQLRYFSSLLVIFSLSELSFQSSILSFCCYHTLSEQSYIVLSGISWYQSLAFYSENFYQFSWLVIMVDVDRFQMRKSLSMNVSSIQDVMIEDL
jgi:hypothetical protein